MSKAVIWAKNISTLIGRRDVFNIVLLIVAAVTLVTDVIIAEKPSWATFLMLIFVVVVSGIISFVQEEKSNSAAQKLQNMITNAE